MSKGLFLRFLTGLIIAFCAGICITSCTPETKEAVFESRAAERYPGDQTIATKGSFRDSIQVAVNKNMITLVLEWNFFTDTAHHCRKVGDIKIFKYKEPECRTERFTLTPLPCAVEWFTGDTVIFEKVLVGGFFEIAKNGQKHSFEGNFCAIDGKGKLEDLSAE